MSKWPCQQAKLSGTQGLNKLRVAFASSHLDRSRQASLHKTDAAEKKMEKIGTTFKCLYGGKEIVTLLA
ncbi:hypothetical protein BRADI_2g38655v3 [Brachypodium distachyon]|uniref:Uncharacterized protein n=1 Tax=Brachypodium distachyon TaxID=15368 RepID=A0A2K2DCM4_BRADI|nr:hypothetical protein BRADI_2g38655v3 [Brachypodium distachyon]